ncbi:mechanosensitive ion channel family protein [Sporosarcina sp. E16_8]|uniref:mechanosensitive ion channel family protein n=1 Tax=Sporosarcina sp. E16_8 TaxID=2789295 RepID=UPI0031F86209
MGVTINEDIKKIKEEVEEVSNILFSSQTWFDIGMLAFKVFFIILLSIIVVKIGKSVIRRAFKVRLKGALRHTERRETTLVKLLQNTLSYVVYFAAILAILSAFTINVTGILAGAGVLGLAVGFGAQSLVKDIISGFFIIFEDQFSVGDYVQIGLTVGTVEEIGLRTTKISAYGGEVHIIPNGNISEVVNYSINNSLAIVDIRLGYETDIAKTEKLLEEYLANLSVGYEALISQPIIVGVQDLGASEIVMRITAETQPVMQYAIARQLRRDLKLFLDQNGIEIPYPKMVMYRPKDEV